jgi:hypothetical protein
MPKSKTANSRIAAVIARDLFTSGNGSIATRLVLELKDTRQFGGWCEVAVVDRIEDMLDRYFPASGKIPE